MSLEHFPIPVLVLCAYIGIHDIIYSYTNCILTQHFPTREKFIKREQKKNHFKNTINVSYIKILINMAIDY